MGGTEEDGVRGRGTGGVDARVDEPGVVGGGVTTTGRIGVEPGCGGEGGRLAGRGVKPDGGVARS